MSQLKGQQKAEEKRETEIFVEAQELKLKLESGEMIVEMKAKAGEDGRLFGSITSKQVAQALNQQYSLKIDKRKMELSEPIKTLGYSNIPVKLHNKVTAKIRVHITEQ